MIIGALGALLTGDGPRVLGVADVNAVHLGPVVLQCDVRAVVGVNVLDEHPRERALDGRANHHPSDNITRTFIDGRAHLHNGVTLQQIAFTSRTSS